jgi:hypothetical protein
VEERHYPQYDSPMLRGQAAIDTERSGLREELKGAKAKLRKATLGIAILFATVPLAQLAGYPPKSSWNFSIAVFLTLSNCWWLLPLIGRIARVRKELEIWNRTSNDLSRELDRSEPAGHISPDTLSHESRSQIARPPSA